MSWNTTETLKVPATALDKLTQRAGQLYSLPAVAMKVLELTNHPEVDIAALKSCIERDPALTTRILRVVNSSVFGLNGQVSNLNQAVALLGTSPLKLLVLGFSLPNELFVGVQESVLTFYWRHSLTKAIAVRTLSRSFGRFSVTRPESPGCCRTLGCWCSFKILANPMRNCWTRLASKKPI